MSQIIKINVSISFPMISVNDTALESKVEVIKIVVEAVKSMSACMRPKCNDSMKTDIATTFDFNIVQRINIR